MIRDTDKCFVQPCEFKERWSLEHSGLGPPERRSLACHEHLRAAIEGLMVEYNGYGDVVTVARWGAW